MEPKHFDGLTWVAVALLVFMGSRILRDTGSTGAVLYDVQPTNVSAAAAASLFDQAQGDQAGGGRLLEFTGLGDQEAVSAPYKEYTLTQGLHGASYGHNAIDLTDGKGADVLSPINGIVTQLYVDEWDNTVLVIENENYQVTLLHGNYTVSVGDKVTLGQVVGTEGNNGNTFDMNGRSCRGRDCGYHSHLNIFDKRTGKNANPLKLIK